MSVTSILILFGALHGIFLGITLIISSYRNEIKANRYFGLMLVGLSAYLLEHFGVKTDFFVEHQKLMLLAYPSLFSIAPLFVIYFLMQGDNKLGRKQILLILSPAFLIYALFIPFYNANMSIENGECPFNTMADFGLNYFVYLVNPYSFPVYSLIILLGSLFYLSNQNILNKIANRIQTRSKWLLQINVILMVYFALFSIGLFFNESLAIYLPFSLYDGVFILLSFIIHFIAYKALIDPQTFSNVRLMKSLTKYESSSLNNEMAKSLLSEIKEKVENERAYLRPDYSIQQLSDELYISRHKVSQVINQELGLTFREYLNQCRVNEAVDHIKENDSGLTMSRLAIDVGFNNKVSFYRAFKRHTKSSPSEFIDSL